MTKEEAINDFREYLEQYEKKCHLPLPQKTQIIMRSIIELQKHDPMLSFVNLRERTKTKIIHQRDLHSPELPLPTNERFR